ncbi:Arc family DNA-binding protein [Shewanella baltica]|uniref:Arc family DNA-binding protein n=1 Tax=Shewanella baltica TaxID=62322 RepID=UPI00217F0E58|nr:Arc family DNA-binding protein [Shewanella baltica]MCS6259886.1 Arc family DNA-binding protein [Shewanella baltica]
MTKKNFPSDTLDKFMLRFPSGMREQIKEESNKNGRSMNAEIVHRLEVSFIADQNSSAASLLHGDALENLLTPTLPASIAGKIARNNANSGIALASVFVDEINELINGAVVLGKRKIELDITKIIGSMPATDAEISIALKLVEKIFDDAGYSVEIKSDSIIMTF